MMMVGSASLLPEEKSVIVSKQPAVEEDVCDRLERMGICN
jgi:hypothetical protein